MNGKNSNKPIVPIDIKKEIAVPKFTPSDPRLGRANRSGRRAASYGSVVGLENSEAALESRAWNAVYGAIQSTMKEKYKKDQKEKEDLITINQIQDGIQNKFDEQAEAIKELQKQSRMPTIASLAQDVLANPDIAEYSESVEDIFDAHKDGDSGEFFRLLEELSRLIPDASEEETKYQKDLAAGIIHTDGLSVDYSYDSFIPTDTEQVVLPTPIKGPVFDPERYEASLSDESEPPEKDSRITGNEPKGYTPPDDPPEYYWIAKREVDAMHGQVVLNLDKYNRLIESSIQALKKEEGK